MRRTYRWIALIALLLCAALALTGCSVNVGGLFSDAENVEATPAPEATPVPPLTAAMFTDYDAVYVHYNEIGFSDTLSGLTERYGEPVAETTTTEDVTSTSYTWKFDDGYGFVCAFYDNGRLRAKVILYEDLRQFRDLSNATYLANVFNLSDSSTFKECINILGGRPIEICQVSQSEQDQTDIARVYTWVDKDDQAAQILFKKDGTISSINTSMQEE